MKIDKWLITMMTIFKIFGSSDGDIIVDAGWLLMWSTQYSAIQYNKYKYKYNNNKIEYRFQAPSNLIVSLDTSLLDDDDWKWLP